MSRSRNPFVNANNRAEGIVFAFFGGLEKHVRGFFRRLFRGKEKETEEGKED